MPATPDMSADLRPADFAAPPVSGGHGGRHSKCEAAECNDDLDWREKASDPELAVR